MSQSKQSETQSAAAAGYESEREADGATSDAPYGPTVPPKSPLWMIVAAAFGAFYHLLGVIFLISPHNRPRLLEPDIAELEAAERSAEDIQRIVEMADKMSPMLLNVLVAIFSVSVVSLIAVIARKRIGASLYMLSVVAAVIVMLIAGIFTPFILIVPTAVTVLISMNRDALR